MWSVGIVLYAALSGTLPYDEKDVHQAEVIVRDRKLMYSHPRWKDVSPEAIDLISNKLLVVQAVSRIRAMVSAVRLWRKRNEQSLAGSALSRLVYGFPSVQKLAWNWETNRIRLSQQATGVAIVLVLADHGTGRSSLARIQSDAWKIQWSMSIEHEYRTLSIVVVCNRLCCSLFELIGS